MRHRPELSHLDAAGIVEHVRAQLDASGDGAAVAVVDDHGELLAFLRTDGCKLPSIDIAINKAYAAARMRTGSTELRRRLREDDFPMTNFGELRYPALGGGAPIVVDDIVVGAVGISGFPEEHDIALAESAAGIVG